MRIAINGFGRIGRNFLRGVVQDKKALSELDIVAINIGPADPAGTAYVFKYDSVLGQFKGAVRYEDGYLYVDDKKIKIIAESDARTLPWESLSIDWVVDCSGHYTQREKAAEHLEAGAKKVLISAPAQGADCTIVPGVNDDAYKKTDTIVSLGSCTTNALMPLLHLIAENFGLESALVVTTHAYTQSQNLLDGFGTHDMRKKRAAAINIIPTTTGAAKMVAEVLPDLAGKVTATALRVPVVNISLLEVTWTSNTTLSHEQIQQACEKYAAHKPEIVAVNKDQLVSSDYIGNSHSVVIDASLIHVQGTLNSVAGWYDNEWAYSLRLKDFLTNIA